MKKIIFRAILRWTLLLAVCIFSMMIMAGCGKVVHSTEPASETSFFGSSLLFHMSKENEKDITDEAETVPNIGMTEEQIESSVVEKSEECVNYVAENQALEEDQTESSSVESQEAVSDKNEETESCYDADWPENEFTKLLTRPELEIESSSLDEHGFQVNFEGISTVQDIIEYAQVVKESGFNMDVEIDARAINDVARYSFWAYNNEGYFVEIYWRASGSGLTIRK